jgi:hypothetical protein
MLEELGSVFHSTPIGELLHLKSYRLVEGTLIYVCIDQQSGHWLIRLTENHRLESGSNKERATDAKNLLKTNKVVLRTWEKAARSQEELLKWIKHLNPGLHTEHWGILEIH